MLGYQLISQHPFFNPVFAPESIGKGKQAGLLLGTEVCFNHQVSDFQGFLIKSIE